MKQLDTLLEEVQIDSDYRADIVDFAEHIALMYNSGDIGGATSLLSQLIKELNDHYDYSSDCGESPWNGVAAWMEEAQAVVDTLTKFGRFMKRRDHMKKQMVDMNSWGYAKDMEDGVVYTFRNSVGHVVNRNGVCYFTNVLDEEYIITPSAYAQVRELIP